MKDQNIFYNFLDLMGLDSKIDVLKKGGKNGKELYRTGDYKIFRTNTRKLE